jgi:DNA-binding Lrp family transcriptional regulator
LANDSKELDRLDRLILNALQDNFPLVPRPFALLAAEISQTHQISVSEEEFISRVRSLKDRKYIRRIGAIFNHDRLGYKSTLCAARVPEDKIENFVKLVNASHKVTHNYLRKDDLNIWFTFCYEKQNELSDFFAHLTKESGVQDIYEMPALKVYKIKAIFNLPE